MANQEGHDPIRTFIAVPLPETLKREVDKLIVSLRPLADGITWVRAGNLHFTLRFLGDIPANSVATLNDSIEQSLHRLTPFSIRLAGLGCFPNMRRPRVIWLDAVGEIEAMTRLASEIEAACLRAGFGPSDKPFSAHLTIGRVKIPRGLEQLMAKMQSIKAEFEPFVVDRIIIYKSDLSPRGPTYTALREGRLG